MSTRIEDYIPFDYMRYVGEILPALEQATRGNTIPLSELITSATHFSLSFVQNMLYHCRKRRAIAGYGLLRGYSMLQRCGKSSLVRHGILGGR